MKATLQAMLEKVFTRAWLRHAMTTLSGKREPSWPVAEELARQQGRLAYRKDKSQGQVGKSFATPNPYPHSTELNEAWWDGYDEEDV